MDKEQLRSEVGLEHMGVNSLYTWMKKYITMPITNNPAQISLSFYREDGFNTKLNISGLDKNNISMVINKVIYFIKSANIHTRMVLLLKIDEKEIGFILTRFRDVEYIHPTRGNKIKHMVLVERINTGYLNYYIQHFSITGMIMALGKDPVLKSVITNNELDPNKLSIATSNLLPETVTQLRVLLSYLDTLTKEEVAVLKDLPFTGIPNYVVDNNNNFEIYLKDDVSTGIFFRSGPMGK